MKKILLTLGGIAALVILLFSMKAINKNSSSNKLTSVPSNLPTIKAGNGFALVELFTSEGCSSCPPADALVNKLSKEKKDNVFILAYHVDYWNRLGWKDKFSKAEFSKRQQNYAGLLHLDGAYTPQIVVNGKTQFVGSDEGKLYSAINKTIANAASAPINISASVLNDQIVVKYKADKKRSAAINVALVQLTGSSQVQKGENGGRFLQHTNIVADLKSLPADGSTTEISFIMPAGFTAAAYNVVAFLQENSGEVIAAGGTDIK